MTDRVAALRDMNPDEGALFASWEKVRRPYPWSEEHFRETARSAASRVLVLDEPVAPAESAPVAFAAVQLLSEEAYLLNIMVAPEHRRKGWGGRMLDLLMDWCRSQQATSLTLEVDPANEAACALYRTRGFGSLGLRRAAYPRGEVAVVMKKELISPWEKK